MTDALTIVAKFRGKYVPIKAVKGRLPSKALGLHLERQGLDLRLYDPVAGQWLPTPLERIALAETETARLRREVEELRRRLASGNPDGE